MSQVMEHVHQLAGVIGPRPAATDAEARTADYIESVFQARGLDVERQEFDAPRTYSWAYVVYNLLTIGAAVLSIWWSLPALVIAILAVVLLMLDLDTRFSIARFLGGGPSQNIIARHVPRQRRGERLRRVVIVAHYDSAKSSLAFSPGLVKNVGLFLRLMKWTTVATAVLILFGALPFASGWKPWTGVVACVAAAYLLLPVFVNVHRELLMHATDGANDNASGVAAMLGVMEATVPEPDPSQIRERATRRSAEAAYESGAAPEDAVLEYRSVAGSGRPTGEQELFDGLGDVGWDTGQISTAQPAAAEPAPPEPASTLPDDWTADAGVDSLWDEPEPTAPAPVETPWRETRTPSPKPAPAPVPARWDSAPMPPEPDEPVAEGQERLEFEPDDQGPTDGAEHQAHGISSWLGIGRGFDVRKAGKKIGSWENIDEDDEEEFGFKAGTAGDLDPDREDSTSDAVSRIRRSVTENVDRALVEKEIWFVATGADEAGMWGVRALLDAHAEDLRDALIINIDSVGSGAVAFITDEGMARSYHADRRLIAQARRTVRENGLPVKGRSYRGLPTSITPALARRFKAMSVMAFDINGRRPNWHWRTDTMENVSVQAVEGAAGFVTALLRDI
ncbi:MAG: M28 family peptidase [Coriobacteriia bacterium]|nr:M28 family peptidase [Coriobacteriia bacterium]